MNAAKSRFLHDLRTFLDDPAATVDGAVELVSEGVKGEILEDVRAGTVPVTVGSFGELHDHVDANGYGGAFHWPGDFCNEQASAFWNRVQNRVDDWLKSGGHR